ncbi:hypothetical protein GCM10025864_03580 [Luteimicrobium album]|uniref:DUF4126 domain-containing protein n=1 Tax=Luteimicrobium album TaxID=1054550 RepID=A0ABQ6HVR0_9MICO|nr:hypothetical protein [Luteimicrobium album]GMA22599.1 hypothetical protein GCM10025864_03580 [Luteimicrobium album]
MNLVVRSALVGVAAGSRSTLGLAQPFLTARRRGLRVLGLLAVGAELVGDKLPTAPSRLDPPGPASRAGAGAVGAVTLARRSGARSVPALAAAAALGAGASTAGTFGGAAWRRLAAERGWPDLPAALGEDAAAVALALLAR